MIILKKYDLIYSPKNVNQNIIIHVTTKLIAKVKGKKSNTGISLKYNSLKIIPGRNIDCIKESKPSIKIIVNIPCHKSLFLVLKYNLSIR